jgi:hypothetical protein
VSGFAASSKARRTAKWILGRLYRKWLIAASDLNKREEAAANAAMLGFRLIDGARRPAPFSDHKKDQ